MVFHDIPDDPRIDFLVAVNQPIAETGHCHQGLDQVGLYDAVTAQVLKERAIGLRFSQPVRGDDLGGCV